MKVKITKLMPDAVIPTYGTEGAAAFDLTAVTVDGYSQTASVIDEHSPVVCETGLAFEVPEGHVMLVFSRSGQGFNHDIRLANCVGVVDSDFRGQVKVKLARDMDYADDEAPIVIKPGDRVAQAMILPVERVQFEEVEELSSTQRGAGGYGSTGR